MKKFSSFAFVLFLSVTINGQSGRRGKQMVVTISPPPAEAPTSPNPPDPISRVTPQPYQDYRCSEDGSLARIIETSEVEPQVFSSREVDTWATIISRPPPVYTKEARRNGVQGFVVLKALLSADAHVDRVRIIKRLPAGLTENAVRVACKIKFKPAIKNGQPVAQLVTVEYVFRLAGSSIFAP